MAKEILFKEEARDKLLKGSQKIFDAVSSTMGPNGDCVMIQRPLKKPLVTKDGVSVAKEVHIKDPAENMAAFIIKEGAEQTNRSAGDGTTTTVVLSYALFREGLKLIKADNKPKNIIKGMKLGVEKTLTILKEMSTFISDSKDSAVSTNSIRDIAMISSNGDEEITNLVVNAIEKVGNDGIIVVNESTGVEDSLNVINGMRFDRGYLSPVFITNKAKKTVEMNKVYFLLTDYIISEISSIIPILEQIKQHNIVVIAKDVNNTGLEFMAINKMKGALRIAAVKAPGFGDRMKEMLEDIAVVTNGRVISEDKGDKLQEITIDDLGFAEEVVIDKDTTTILRGKGDKDKIKERTNELKEQLKNATTDFDRGKLEERIARLSGGIALISVGGNTDLEVKEKRDRVDDAIGACKSAIEEGVVPGGGTTFIDIASQLSDYNPSDVEVANGFRAVLKALEYPIDTICGNADIDSGIIKSKIRENKLIGYDINTGEKINPYEKGILDPTKVLRVALENALSVAITLLTTRVLMIEENPMENELPDLTGLA